VNHVRAPLQLDATVALGASTT